MELRDYLRMLRRGWLTIILAAAIGVTIASVYVATAPKRYEASTVLYVSAASPASITDLQQGASFAGNAVITYAQIISSGAVLGPVAAELRPQRSIDDLVGNVSTSVREDTTLIDISAAGTDARSAAVLANATADSAVRILPTLQSTPDGRPLVRVQQTRPALEPTAPAAPNPTRVLAIGLVVGLFAGLGGTLVRQTLDSRLRRSEDLAQLTDVPLVAVLPTSSTQTGRGASGALVARDDPTSDAGEAFRTLRTNLGGFTSRDPRSLVFTALTEDNAVQVPANLAWSIAQAGRRVLLVDADMRTSPLVEALGMEPGPGLAEAIVGQVAAGPVTHATEDPALRVMLSGSTTSAPSDLLSTPAFEHLLRRLEQEYDIVLLHMPALLTYADAAVGASAAGGTFVTVSAGTTRAEDLMVGLDALENVRVRPLGLVLVGASRDDRPKRARRGGSGGAPKGAAQPSPTAANLDSPTLRQNVARPRPSPRHPNGTFHPSPASNTP